MLAGSLESIGRREINKKYETNYSLPKLGKLPSKKKLIVKDTLIKEGEESSCKKKYRAGTRNRVDYMARCRTSLLTASKIKLKFIYCAQIAFKLINMDPSY